MRPSLQELVDFAEAVVFLGLARLRLFVAPAGCLVSSDRQFGRAAERARAQTTLDRARIAVARAARRVPWRSDCLVQALAAQSWLRSRHVPTELRIGVRQSPHFGRDIQAHAWLTYKGEVVVGGDISDQIELYRTSARAGR